MNAAEADLRASVRTLLASPLLRRAAAPDAYERVRRNLAPVEAWFAQTTGWSVVHDRPSGLIRVLKITDRSDATRSPVPEFTRRHYAIACLLLAELDRAGRQTTLRWLAEQLAEATRAEPTIEDYDATQIGERRAFVHVVRWLVDGVGVLRGRDPAGAGETRYLQTERGSDALYDVDDRVLALLLAAPRSPSALASPAELAEGEAIETDDMQRLARGRRVYRRLLDEPVVYFDTLAQDEHDWLLRSLRRVTEQLARIGLVIERRLEGIAVIDPEGELCDERFPRADSTRAHTALLLAEWLSSVRGCTRLEVNRQVAHWKSSAVGRRWKQESAREIADSALALLERFGLVALDGDRVEARPAIARFRAEMGDST